jgi:hypothetical protein
MPEESDLEEGDRGSLVPGEDGMIPMIGSGGSGSGGYSCPEFDSSGGDGNLNLALMMSGGSGGSSKMMSRALGGSGGIAQTITVRVMDAILETDKALELAELAIMTGGGAGTASTPVQECGYDLSSAFLCLEKAANSYSVSPSNFYDAVVHMVNVFRSYGIFDVGDLSNCLDSGRMEDNLSTLYKTKDLSALAKYCKSSAQGVIQTYNQKNKITQSNSTDSIR